MPNTPGTSGLVMNEPLVFELGSPGRRGYSLPQAEVEEVDPAAVLGEGRARAGLDGFPELSEVDVVRHFTRLSQWNYGVDTGFYPLGSCTMKYNPKINENAARMDSMALSHPYQPEDLSQGALELLYMLEQYLAEISGMDRVTLQPAAGAHGELTGLMLVRAYHEAQSRPRRKVIIPDTAHGTNPASVTLSGYECVPVTSNERGMLDVEAVSAVMDEETAGIMVTNPNTLGIFEGGIRDI